MPRGPLTIAVTDYTGSGGQQDDLVYGWHMAISDKWVAGSGATPQYPPIPVETVGSGLNVVVGAYTIQTSYQGWTGGTIYTIGRYVRVVPVWMRKGAGDPPQVSFNFGSGANRAIAASTCICVRNVDWQALETGSPLALSKAGPSGGASSSFTLGTTTPPAARGLGIALDFASFGGYEMREGAYPGAGNPPSGFPPSQSPNFSPSSSGQGIAQTQHSPASLVGGVEGFRARMREVIKGESPSVSKGGDYGGMVGLVIPGFHRPRGVVM